jgi:hypothetical protein
LRSAPFRWLVVASTVDRIGGSIAPVALAFAVLDLTGSTTSLGLVVGARSLANVIFLLIGGVVADRLPRAIVSGLGIEQFGVAWQTSMHQHVPPSVLARVSSYDALGSFIAIPLGEVAAGPVSHAIGTCGALVGASALILVAALGALASRSVRTLANQDEPAAEPVA